MNKLSEREALIEEIKKHHWSSDSTIGYDNSEEIADFILEDRKRIVEPLVNKLEDIHNALDIALGDTDPDISDDMTDAEILDEEPLFWATKEVELLRQKVLKRAAIN